MSENTDFRFCVLRKTAVYGGVDVELTWFDNNGTGYTYAEAQDRLQYEFDCWLDYHRVADNSHAHHRFLTSASADNGKVASNAKSAEWHVLPMEIERDE